MPRPIRQPRTVWILMMDRFVGDRWYNDLEELFNDPHNTAGQNYLNACSVYRWYMRYSNPYTRNVRLVKNLAYG